MERLRSGLLGTTEDVDAEEAVGRPPLESVETGHVGLAHRTRRGDGVRSWYRGPLVPHPTADPPEGRLPLAHTADQVRVVVPDGREDISLAAAFEIGRLLALSRPSMVSSLLRWRQLGYQAAQREAALAGQGSILAELGAHEILVDRDLGGHLAGVLAEVVATRPEHFLGDPSPLVTPGRPVFGDERPSANEVLAGGLGLGAKILSGSPQSVLGKLATADAPVTKVRRGFDAGVLNAALQPRLAGSLERLAVDALAEDPRFDAIVKSALSRRPGGSEQPGGHAGPGRGEGS